VTHEESRAENDKDTRAIEASYLARGQAARVDELRDAVTHFEALQPIVQGPEEPVRAGSLLELEDESSRILCWLSVASATFEVDVDGRSIRVVSTRSPIGRALLGRLVEDDVEFPTPKGTRAFSIVGVW
jgi:transcription elongation GreA/GreB family factor